MMMKRWMAALVTLALLLMGVSAPAEGASGPALPAMGSVVHGFEVVEVRDFPLVDATVIRFEHQSTGAGLVYIANGDTNRVFDLTFLTQAVDDTGLPHVFEHATLDGSEKYPSRSLFFNLSYQTYNTYMNASTYQIMTTYPIASLSEAQLLKFADFYTDSCLNPMVLEDERIFREEAWRYRLDSPEDALTIEGTVYSEMLGASTLSRAAGYNSRRAALPGSRVGNDSGGDPAHIPEMTYEALRRYHDLYYHPSNCVAYLYGQFDDYAAFLALLDAAFSPFGRAEFALEDPDYAPIDGPVEAEYAFPVEATSDTADAAEVYYAFVCPGLKGDAPEELLMSTLADVLSSDSSALGQRMKRALPKAGFGCYLDEQGPDDVVVFVANHVNRGDAAVFRATVDDALKDLVENGFAQDMVDGVMASLELSMRLTTESSDVGVGLIPSFAYDYAASGEPFRYMDYVDALSRIDAWNREGRYAEAASRWLAGSGLTALTTTYPEAGLKERQDAEKAAALAAVKAGLSEDEVNAIVEASATETVDDADTAAMVAGLQAVTVASLPEERRQYEITDTTGEDGIRRVDAVAGVEGIGRVALFFDAQGLPQEDIHWFHLFADLIGELDTAEHTREELDVLIDRYLYGIETRLSLMGDGTTYRPWLRLGWIAVDEDQAAAYDLMREIVYETDFTNAQYLLENVQQIRAQLKSQINAAPYNVLLYRGFAVTQPMWRYYSYYNYLEFYAFLEEAERLLTSNPEAAVDKIESVRRYFDNATNAIAAYAGSEAGIALNRPLADAYLDSLDRAPIVAETYDLPVPAKSEGLIADASVQFNLMTADFDAIGLEGYSAGYEAVTAAVNDAFLLPLLRDQYGAYAVWHEVVDEAGMYVISYRDPNVGATFDVYDRLPALVGDMDIDQATLDGYILSAYTGYAQSTGELSGAMSALVNALDGHSQDEVLEHMRQLKAVTPQQIADSAALYGRFVESAVRATAGSASVINANADRYEAILNPFDASDDSARVLGDVPGDLAEYDAVRYAVENALMGAAASGGFEPDAPATAGDIAAALYAVSGGTSFAPDEAVVALVEYGVLWEDAAPDEPIDAAACRAILESFTYAVGVEDAPDVAVTGEPFTRARLAQALYDYLAWLEDD